jgi:hypothetical protein
MRGLPRNVKNALEKARDAALLAVEVYNKPAVKFKSGGYISLMVIAWTSLLHAVFLKRRLKPFYRKANGHFVRVDGDFKYWELDECLRQYFNTDTGHPVRRNLEFFIPLRNRIEHRSMPELDSSIFGECQAMLLNLDEMLLKEFGAKYCLRECLSFSLQLFPSAESLVDAVKHNPETKPVVEFIQRYRSTISSEVTASGKYSFKAFLIQVANHKAAEALPIQFIHYDKLSEEQRSQVAHLVAMVKFKEVPVANPDLMKAGEVVVKVQAGLGNQKIQRGKKQIDRFNLTIHASCWRRYKVRPNGGDPNPQQTDSRYCVYDKLHSDYGYTQAWVDFLIEKLSDSKEFDSHYKLATPPVAGPSPARRP